MSKHIVVIGGGAAGSAAAYALNRFGHNVTVTEKNNRLGGRIQSHSINGTGVELGAAFMTRAYTNVLTFIQSSGLGDAVYSQRDSVGIIKQGKAIEANFTTWFRGDVLDWGGKAQALRLLSAILVNWLRIDIHKPFIMDRFDTTPVSAIFGAAANPSLLENVLQPILNGYFYWEPETTSKAILYEIIKALLKGGTYKISGGLQQIPETATKDCTILLNSTALKVYPAKSGYQVTIKTNGTVKTIAADGVVCATTANVVPTIMQDLSTQQAEFFTSIQYSSTAVLAKVYSSSDILGDKGFAIPRTENSPLAAITVSPEPDGTSQSLSSLRAYVSGKYGKEFCQLNDNELNRRLEKAANQYASLITAPGAQPVAQYIQKWPEAIPRFDVGHFKKLRDFEQGSIESHNKPLVFAGDYLGGPFIEGAFSSGLHAATRLHKIL